MHCILEAVKVKYSTNVKLKILKHVEKSRHLEDKQRFVKLSRCSPDVTRVHIQVQKQHSRKYLQVFTRLNIFFFAKSQNSLNFLNRRSSSKDCICKLCICYNIVLALFILNLKFCFIRISKYDIYNYEN